jgi:ribonuclease BN (tRNA processing enzyme)
MLTRRMKRSLWILLIIMLATLSISTQVMASQCQSERVKLQILGSRGPELWDGQASTSYLLWLDDKASLVIDAGAGSVQNFERSGAAYKDLRLFLFSHFHIDHSSDFPAYVKGGFFTQRDHDLMIFGPSGNDYLPSAEQFLQRLFGKSAGLYPYLNGFIDPAVGSSYKVQATTIPSSYEQLDERQIYADKDISITAVAVHHGILPALGYRVEIAGCVISFTGDMSGRFHTMEKLALDSDILVAHNAIPESETGAGQLLHMKPSYIGEMAGKAKVKQLLLTHLMKRSIDHKDEAVALINKNYKGKISFPKDLDLVRP